MKDFDKCLKWNFVLILLFILINVNLLKENKHYTSFWNSQIWINITSQNIQILFKLYHYKSVLVFFLSISDFIYILSKSLII